MELDACYIAALHDRGERLAVLRDGDRVSGDRRHEAVREVDLCAGRHTLDKRSLASQLDRVPPNMRDLDLRDRPAWGGRIWPRTFCGRLGEIVLERSMSLRLAAAATIGIGLLATGAAQARPEMVGAPGEYSPGTIVVKTNERRLYLSLDDNHAVRYPVGVGKFGKQWAGTTRISGKYLNPAWSPPAEVKHDKPNIPDVIPGGSPRNPPRPRSARRSRRQRDRTAHYNKPC